MAEEGIFLPPSQFEGMFLSTAHTEEHIAKTVEAFHTVFAKLAKINHVEAFLNSEIIRLEGFV